MGEEREREGMRDEKWRGGGGLFFFLASFCTLNPAPLFYLSLLEKPLESSHKAYRGVCVCACALREP